MTIELTESQINGRFKINPKPVASPGKCSVCGSVERAVVDFGLDVEFYGAVVICTECFICAAQILDLVPGEKLRTAQLVQLDHEHQLNEAGRVANEYNAKLSDLLTEFANSLRDINNGTVSESNEGPAESVGSESLPVEQVPDAIVSKRPDSVSRRNSDGFDLF